MTADGKLVQQIKFIIICIWFVVLIAPRVGQGLAFYLTHDLSLIGLRLGKVWNIN